MKNNTNSLKLLLFCLWFTLTSACSIQQKPVVGWFQNSGASGYDQLLAQGRHLVNDRYHQKAIAVFDHAGAVMPCRPEWLYEKARALFYMDRLSEAIIACRKALDRDPSFYEALSFGWTVRLHEQNSAEPIKEAVRLEIENLLNNSEKETDVLMAAFEGYQLLKDREQEQEQNLIIKLAQQAGAEDRKTRELISSRLFEQIIQARNDAAARILLLETYAVNFPAQRHTEYIVFQLLKTKQEQAEDGFEAKPFAEKLLERAPESQQIKTGVAYWLIENDQHPEMALQLLRQSLLLAEQNAPHKPSFFDPKLWEKELENQKDRLTLLLGRAWFNAGKYDEAATVLGRMTEKNRQWGDLYYYLAKIAVTEGKKGEAIINFRRALESGEREDDAEAMLRELLASEYGVEEDPAQYFSEADKIIRFTDVTEAAGLSNVSARRVAWGDFDNDGFDDLLLDGNRLFKNAENGTFVDITEASGLNVVKNSNGGIWGDYNNDGYLDIFVTGHTQNHLFENMGKGYFANQTKKLPDSAKRMQTEAVAWGDLDNDGFLDLYIANYETWGVMRAIGNHDRLYHNINGSRFADITDQAGIKSDEAMCGRGVTWTDVNLDGFQDIVVANYRLDPNFLWLNHGATFTDNAQLFNVRGYMNEGAFGHSIGPVSGDIDGDGNPDLFITNLAHPRYIEFSDVNMMLINKGWPDYHFKDDYADSGIFFEETNSDPSLADIDNDGDLDLYITSIYPGRYSRLYMNNGKGSFHDISWASGTRVENSWGAAFSDFNNDGFQDLIVASSDGVHLFKNTGNANHWITVRIDDMQCNRFGIGSRVTLKYGGRQQVREVIAGRGTGSQDSSELIFGLADYSGAVEIEVRTLCGDILQQVVDYPDQEVVFIQ